MSLPKPDLHVRLEEESMYWLRTLAAIEGRPVAEIATEILAAELERRAEHMTAVAKRLVADGKVRAPAERPLFSTARAVGND